MCRFRQEPLDPSKVTVDQREPDAGAVEGEAEAPRPERVRLGLERGRRRQIAGVSAAQRGEQQ